ncbi:chitin deacetylase 1 [Umbelopsis sp. PMI_123]|nr:chitin deacetylase 1 [Umbelopsis sp. PMI_123]
MSAWKQVFAVAAFSAATVAASNMPLNLPNITVPVMSQTTSLDVNTECTYYTLPNLVINATDWPTIWDTATTNGMNTSAEFTTLYNSINWANAPNISVRTLVNGSLDFTNYPTSDPDCWWSYSLCTTPKLAGVNADIYQCNEPETWGLTYDDGPNCSHNAFYDFLQEQSLTASFFYIGSNVMDWPAGAMRGLADGHHISAHTWSHQLMTTLTNQEVLAELYYTQKALKTVLGIEPKYWRPPFGDVDDRVRWIASQLNLTAIIWNLDTSDWAAGDGETVAQVQASYEAYITMGTNGTFANSGNIVLTHEIDNTTMSLAIEYLPQIKAAYKNVLDIATCANLSQPYFDSNITYLAFGVSNVTAAANGTAAASSAAVSTAGAAGASTTIKNAATMFEPKTALMTVVSMILVGLFFQ